MFSVLTLPHSSLKSNQWSPSQPDYQSPVRLLSTESKATVGKSLSTRRLNLSIKIFLFAIGKKGGGPFFSKGVLLKFLTKSKGEPNHKEQQNMILPRVPNWLEPALQTYTNILRRYWGSQKHWISCMNGAAIVQITPSLVHFNTLQQSICKNNSLKLEEYLHQIIIPILLRSPHIFF